MAGHSGGSGGRLGCRSLPSCATGGGPPGAGKRGAPPPCEDGGGDLPRGGPCLGLYVVATGRVKVSKLSAEGREQVLHAERKGALGEAPLFDDEPYPASALALEPAVLLFLPKQTVLAWCRRRPDVAIGIARTLARRMRSFAALAEGLALREVSQRLAGYLVRRASEGGHKVQSGVEILLEESNQEIAAQIGTVRELVSRMLASLRREGLIAVSGRRITILDAKRLRARSGPA